jgi:hypothetical protein
LGYFTAFWTKTTYGPYSVKWRLNYNEARIKWQQSSRADGSPVRCYKDAQPLNLPPSAPSNPIPLNGAASQSLEAELSWSCYDPEGDPITFDVYFGLDEDPPLISTGQTESAFDPGELASNTNYFWKVVAYDNQGNSTVGNVWSFTTSLVNLPPLEPSDPSPEDGALNQSTETGLAWICSDPEGDLLIYIVFFGKDAIPDLPTSIEMEATYDPGLLEPNAVYFWKIMAVDNQGNFVESSIWSFQTTEE